MLDLQEVNNWHLKRVIPTSPRMTHQQRLWRLKLATFPPVRIGLNPPLLHTVHLVDRIRHPMQ